MAHFPDRLSPVRRDIWRVLSLKPGRLLPHGTPLCSDGALKVHIHHLRSAMPPDWGVISTVFGQGYRFIPSQKWLEQRDQVRPPPRKQVTKQDHEHLSFKERAAAARRAMTHG